MNNHGQNIKQAAYFDYFKSFSINAYDSIIKLQSQFHDQIQLTIMSQSPLVFKKIKTLLSSYQILIYQINDSCQFVEIPQFGKCISRIFVQIMSIVKFLLSRIVMKSQKKFHQIKQISKGQRNNTSFNFVNNNNQNKNKNCNYQTNHPFSKTNKINNNNKGNMNCQCTCHYKKGSQTPPAMSDEIQRNLYRKKQQSRFIMHGLQQQLSILQNQQLNYIENYNKQYRFLLQGKQRLRQIQVSQNQNIISQTLNNFSKKGEHLKNFVNLRQQSMLNNMKDGKQDIKKVNQLLNQGTSQKMNQASNKLQTIFKHHVENYILEKQGEMLTKQIQVDIYAENQTNKMLQDTKQKNKQKQKIKKLQRQIGYQKQKLVSLQQLLKQKTQQFQIKLMQCRVEKLDMTKKLQKSNKMLDNQQKYRICNDCKKKKSVTQMSTPKQYQVINVSMFEENQKQSIKVQTQPKQQGQHQVMRKKRFVSRFGGSYIKQNSTKKGSNLFQQDNNHKNFNLEIFSKTIVLCFNKNHEYIINQPIQLNNRKLNIIDENMQQNKSSKMTPQKINDRKIKTNNKLEEEKNLLCQKDSISNNLQFQEEQLQDCQNIKNSSSVANLNNNKKNSDSQSSEKKSNKMQRTQKILHNKQGILQTQPLINKLNKKNNLIEQNRTPQQSQRLKSVQNKLQSKNQNISKKSSPFLLNNKQTISQHQRYFTKMLTNKNIYNSSKQTTLQISYNNKKYLKTSSNIDDDQEFYNSKQILSNNNQKSHSKFLFENNLLNQKFKYPRIIKFNQKKPQISMNLLYLVFFDQSTAKNFQYVNLYQSDENKLTHTNNLKKYNSVNVNIQQVKNKKIICQFKQNNSNNKLINKAAIVRNSSALKNICENKKPYFENIHNQTIDIKVSMKVQLPVQQNNMNTQIITPTTAIQYIKQLIFSYDSQTLSAYLYKTLKQLKKHSSQYQKQLSFTMTSYQKVRNFFRYPFSAITLYKDKQFIQKQKNDKDIQFMELRKIVKRILKLHRNCKEYYCEKKDGVKENGQGRKNQNKNQEHSQIVLCEHVVKFYQQLGIELVPKMQSL